jgi:hypothetical protein
MFEVLVAPARRDTAGSRVFSTGCGTGFGARSSRSRASARSRHRHPRRRLRRSRSATTTARPTRRAEIRCARCERRGGSLVLRKRAALSIVASGAIPRSVRRPLDRDFVAWTADQGRDALAAYARGLPQYRAA